MRDNRSIEQKIRKMLYYTGTGDTLVIPSEVCEYARLDLAHAQMRHHLACRIDHCAWKWVAYATLVHHGRVVPPLTTPRDRAHHRGLLPISAASSPYLPEPQSFRQIRDDLDRLARELRDSGGTP